MCDGNHTLAVDEVLGRELVRKRVSGISPAGCRLVADYSEATGSIPGLN